ncbi:MAG: hypothetical protein JSW68_12630, partial [Burkholderiales bacterium]
MTDPGQAAGAEGAGPIEQRFAEPIEGPAYTGGLKAALLLIDLIMLGAGGYIFASERDVPTHMIVFGWTALALILVTTWDIWTARTRIDSEGIHRRAIFDKTVRWQEIRRVRYLRLLPSPRLMIRTSHGPFKVFYAGEPRLREAFA